MERLALLVRVDNRSPASIPRQRNPQRNRSRLTLNQESFGALNIGGQPLGIGKQLVFESHAKNESTENFRTGSNLGMQRHNEIDNLRTSVLRNICGRKNRTTLLQGFFQQRISGKNRFMVRPSNPQNASAVKQQQGMVPVRLAKGIQPAEDTLRGRGSTCGIRQPRPE